MLSQDALEREAEILSEACASFYGVSVCTCNSSKTAGEEAGFTLRDESDDQKGQCEMPVHAGEGNSREKKTVK